MAAKPKTAKKEAAADAPQVVAPLRVKDLLERLEPKTKLKKKDLREMVDLVLGEIGGALTAGHGLSLQGLGHVKVMRKGDNGVTTLRLRPFSAEAGAKKGDKAAEGAEEALADAGEAD